MFKTSSFSRSFQQSLFQLSGFILWPFGLIYRWLTGFRNHLYDIQYKRSVAFSPFIIDVGNLSVGGTGKSPMIEYLAQWLQEHYSLAILSRGYRRQTRGFRLAGQKDTAATLGDEPFQFYRRFFHLPQVVVAVGEERVAAVPEILFQHPDTRLILLDDAFQHRAIAADLHILLTTFQRPFYNDYILPVGRLREARKEAGRADVVVVTKCPESVTPAARQQMQQRIQHYTGTQVPVFFAGIRYGMPVKVLDGAYNFSPDVILFSGLASHKVFESYARSHYRVLESISFGDHHRYHENDARRIRHMYESSGRKTCLLTTEKDMVKLIDPALSAHWEGLPLFYLPIQTYFLDEEDLFKNVILRRIQQYYQQ